MNIHVMLFEINHIYSNSNPGLCYKENLFLKTVRIEDKLHD